VKADHTTMAEARRRGAYPKAALIVWLCLLLASCGGQNPAPGNAVVQAPTTPPALPQAVRTDFPEAVRTDQPQLPPPAPTQSAVAALELTAGPFASWDEKFADWSYQATLGHHSLSLYVNCTPLHPNCNGNKFATPDDVNRYVALNRQLVASLQGSADVQVQFRRPLTDTEFNAFVQREGLKPSFCAVSLVDHISGYHDMPGIGPACIKGEQPPLHPPSSPEHEIFGVVFIVISADQTKIEQLLGQPEVFGVDVMQAIAWQHARKYVLAHYPDIGEIKIDDPNQTVKQAYLFEAMSYAGMITPAWPQNLGGG
jgi:hypothetical protein